MVRICKRCHRASLTWFEAKTHVYHCFPSVPPEISPTRRIHYVPDIDSHIYSLDTVGVGLGRYGVPLEGRKK